MNIIVLMKRTFDTEEKVEIKSKSILKDGVEFVINPYDEFAIEEAINLREKHGGEVIVLTVGSKDSEKEVRTALAMGADKAILVENEGLETDEHTVAHILAATIKEKEFDIILSGNVSVDNSASQVGVRVAELLDIPQVTSIIKLEINGNKAIAERDLEGDSEIVEVGLPCLFTAQQGLNEPRYPSLPGIMKAKKKPLEQLTLENLNLNLNEVEAKTEVIEYFLPPEKKAGRILDGELTVQVQELVKLLCDEAQVV